MKKILAAALALTMTVSGTALAETIKRVPGVDMDDLSNCEVRAGFTAADISGTDITASIYDEVAYDIADIAGLKVGDVIETSKGDVTVERLSADAGIEINGGLEEGGVTLLAEDENNRYTEVTMNADALILVGQARLALADTVAIRTYKMDDFMSPVGEGYDTIEVAAADAAGVMSGLAEKYYMDEFYPEQFFLTIENDQVTEITMEYMP